MRKTESKRRSKAKKQTGSKKMPIKKGEQNFSSDEHEIPQFNKTKKINIEREKR